MIVDGKLAESIWDPRLAHLVNRALFVAALLLLLVSLYSFIPAALDHVDHNDFMYAVAPVVWSQGGNLYSEVPFVQAPLSIIFPTLCSAPGSLDTSLSHAAGLIEIAACHA